MPPASVRPDQKKELHAICADLERLRIAQGFAKAVDFARAAGHSVSTWHAWRRPEPTSPKFFDLRDFARVVGLDVAVLLRDGALRGDTSFRKYRQGDDTMKTETAEVARLMDRLPDDVRQEVRDYVLDKIAERVNPDEPGAAHGSPRARRG